MAPGLPPINTKTSDMALNSPPSDSVTYDLAPAGPLPSGSKTFYGSPVPSNLLLPFGGMYTLPMHAVPGWQQVNLGTLQAKEITFFHMQQGPVFSYSDVVGLAYTNLEFARLDIVKAFRANEMRWESGTLIESGVVEIKQISCRGEQRVVGVKRDANGASMPVTDIFGAASDVLDLACKMQIVKRTQIRVKRVFACMQDTQTKYQIIVKAILANVQLGVFMSWSQVAACVAEFDIKPHQLKFQFSRTQIFMRTLKMEAAKQGLREVQWVLLPNGITGM